MAQPVSDESKSLVKKRGKGVAEGAGVEVDSGIGVAGMGEGGSVEVGKNEGVGVCAAVWPSDGDRQADVRRRHPIRRSFFMAFLIT